MNATIRPLLLIALIFELLSSGSLRAAELKSIGVSVADLGNPFFVEVAESITDKARQLATDARLGELVAEAEQGLEEPRSGTSE